MNVKLLRKIKRHILEEPARLYMWSFVRRKGVNGNHVDGRPFARCGTAACIAGWACILSNRDDSVDHMKVGMELLGLTAWQAIRLFDPPFWPAQFERGTNGDGTKETAEIAAARIEKFISSKGQV